MHMEVSKSLCHIQPNFSLFQLHSFRKYPYSPHGSDWDFLVGGGGGGGGVGGCMRPNKLKDKIIGISSGVRGGGVFMGEIWLFLLQ